MLSLFVWRVWTNCGASRHAEAKSSTCLSKCCNKWGGLCIACHFLNSSALLQEAQQVWMSWLLPRPYHRKCCTAKADVGLTMRRRLIHLSISSGMQTSTASPSNDLYPCSSTQSKRNTRRCTKKCPTRGPLRNGWRNTILKTAAGT